MHILGVLNQGNPEKSASNSKKDARGSLKLNIPVNQSLGGNHFPGPSETCAIGDGRNPI